MNTTIDNIIELSDVDRNLTSFSFYSDFLEKLSKYYRSEYYKNNPKPVELALINPVFIDPAILPLFIGLGLYLKKFHNRSIKLHLSNTPETVQMIKFLDQYDFFNIIGDNNNPNFPLGLNIFDFNENMIGSYGYKKDEPQIRKEHKLKYYCLPDNVRKNYLATYGSDSDRIRSILIANIRRTIEYDFPTILTDYHEKKIANNYYSVLEELLANALWHSMSDCFVMANSSAFKTSISVVDMGIGLFQSLKLKESLLNYKPFELLYFLESRTKLKVSNVGIRNAYVIIEALYFSLLKSRLGLVDLLINVILKSSGRLRIHNISSQIVFSEKLEYEIIELSNIRNSIRSLDRNDPDSLQKIKAFSNEGKSIFLKIVEKLENRYSTNIQISPLRFYSTKFNGVHIEADLNGS